MGYFLAVFSIFFLSESERSILYLSHNIKTVQKTSAISSSISVFLFPSKAANELRLSDDLKGPPVVELGRITYKSSGASMYIPKRIAKLFHLNREEDSSLVIFSVEDYGFFLIKDTAIAQRLKPEILDLRKSLEEYASNTNST